MTYDYLYSDLSLIFINRSSVLSHSSISIRWTSFQQRCVDLSHHPALQPQGTTGSVRMVFRFEEGILIKALREGQWLILDEVNLAMSDVLQRIRGLLDPSDINKFILSENDGEEITPHPEFRIFACMNPSIQPSSYAGSSRLIKSTPASGIGKKELPPGIRQCFTEIFVDEVDESPDLQNVISRYLPHSVIMPSQSIAAFYLSARNLSRQHLISDGSGKAPHYSLRVLVRATRFASSVSTRKWRAKSPLVSTLGQEGQKFGS